MLVFLATMFVIAGCELEEMAETPAVSTPAPTPAPQPAPVVMSLSSLELTNKITAEWKTSDKVFAITDPAGRGIGCAKCHDGYGFSMFKTFDPAVAGAPAYAPKHATGIDCQACHTGQGKELMESGSVKLLFMDQPLQAGKSAMCLSCHNSNRNPKDLAAQFKAGTLTQMTYPHYGMQGAVYTGKGGMEIPGVTLPSSPMHSQIQCSNCHMPTTEEGYKSHSFKADVEKIDKTCGTCHTGITSFDHKGFRSEMNYMLGKLKKATMAKAGASDLTYGSGRFTFHDAKGAAIDMKMIPFEAYVGAYNWRLIALDGSLGIHNPQYSKAIVKETYKFVTGEELK